MSDEKDPMEESAYREHIEHRKEALIENFILAIRHRLANKYLYERTPENLLEEIQLIYGDRARRYLLASAQVGRVDMFCRRLVPLLRQIPDWSDW